MTKTENVERFSSLIQKGNNKNNNNNNIKQPPGSVLKNGCSKKF